MKLVIDSREQKIIDILLKNNHSFITNNLPVGDIILCDDEANENIEGTTSVLDHASAIYNPNESLAICARKYIIIERKTIDDLAASIVDGRYREQKHRLLATSMAEKCDILYIIEGVLSSKNFVSSRTSSKKSISPERSMSSKVIFGAIISTIMRDGIKIVQTKNPETTVDFILQLKKRYEEKSIFPLNGYEKIINGDHAVAMAQQLQYGAREITGVKKENMTKEIFFMMCLISLPGISSLTAKVITQKYNTISQIYEDGKEIVYDNIRNMITSNGRRIGDKKALTLIEYFFD